MVMVPYFLGLAMKVNRVNFWKFMKIRENDIMLTRYIKRMAKKAQYQLDKCFILKSQSR